MSEWIKLGYAIHPGEILKEYLTDSGMSQKELAIKTGLNKTFLNEIIKGKRPITMATALKLEKAFSFDAQFWGNLQLIYDEAVERLKQNKEFYLISAHMECTIDLNSLFEAQFDARDNLEQTSKTSNYSYYNTNIVAA